MFSCHQLVSFSVQVLKLRYERLRSVAGRIQNALGDLASMGERLHSLLSWRDPRYIDTPLSRTLMILTT